MGKHAFSGKFTTIRSLQWTHNLKFGMLVFERRKKIVKKYYQKPQKFHYCGGLNFLFKNCLRFAGYKRKLFKSAFFIETKISDLVG